MLVPVIAALGACSSGDTVNAVATPSASTSATQSPPAPPTTLLSGREGRDHKVLAVKLDNTSNSNPHTGLVAADVVYLEEVEYGLTRYLAVYSSDYPKEIGPVRSARISDLELVRQFGKVGFVFSGAQRLLLDDIARAFVYPVSADAGNAGFSRDPDRVAPWDLMADPDQLVKEAPKARKAKDVGFVFDESVPRGGRDVKSVTAAWPGAQARFKWSESAQRWLLWMDGQAAESTEGPQLGGTTVIIQSVKSYPSSFGDSFGGVTPMTETVGRGKALLLRDGQVWPIKWSRPKAEDGTTWRYRGHQISMAPGQVWVALLDDDNEPRVTK